MSSSRHPDSTLNPSQIVSNDSGNRDIYDVIAQRPMTRRDFFRVSTGAAAGVAVTATLGGALMGSREAVAAMTVPGTPPTIGFAPIAPNTLPMVDAVSVPAGYTARTVVAWGDLLGTGAAWDVTQPMDEATQSKSYGAHTDGMHYFPFPGALGNTRGLLVSNSEYVDPALLNGIAPASAYLTAPLTLAMVRAQQAAHGLNVVEVQKQGGEWKVRRPSAYNRRVTGNTPCDVSGSAAGHALLRTDADPSGRKVLGTLNNCANGYTPWGTYLTCEENFNGYFGAAAASIAAQPLSSHERRYGFSAAGFGYRWHEADARFDLRAPGNVNEGNRFGWVVEVDPFNPRATPVKRTAMGRFKHESAALALGSDNRVAYYMGDDERNEYVYKFVCAKQFNPVNMAANRSLLDEGTLYVARFNADGSGVWLPLVWGQNSLTPENGFADQGEVLVKTRQAADRLGATMMDRPEWTAVHPETLEVYLTLTNNSRRGNTPASANRIDGSSPAASTNPPVDAANPRPDNDYGHILRWRENGGSVAATAFEWDVFIQCGDKQVSGTAKTLPASYSKDNLAGIDPADPQAGKKLYAGDIVGDDFGAPDGLWFDREGRLWVQTDQPGDAQGDWVNIGGNAMLCVDTLTREVKRFLTGPKNCEVTGVAGTPDGKTLFVGIQHPGEDWSNGFTDRSTWPDSGVNGPTAYSGLPSVYKPRSGILAVTRDDGGVVGA
jgi:secreted PhoX family phosphatase